MSSYLAIALVAGLCAVHLRLRRHAGWTASTAGRTYVLLGYSMTALAAYWLAFASTVAWEWIVGCAWSLAAAMSFAAGSSALKRVTAEHARRAAEWETIAPATGRLHL